ncbi:DNAJ domain-containing protein [Emericellopsis atlantica]|uniref:DNAJ domain-containing protein n=1 Tax=Emericellopsis atlantica TaxID=2614577 RepID=A0A9P7ZS05_9HYPO|nr:DNAJ domain-containing protein [Emericellopsis atlantica]KAG9257239.1 DNAJ domain-containing protein [Emericellopsis atlantica]
MKFFGGSSNKKSSSSKKHAHSDSASSFTNAKGPDGTPLNSGHTFPLSPPQEEHFRDSGSHRSEPSSPTKSSNNTTTRSPTKKTFSNRDSVSSTSSHTEPASKPSRPFKSSRSSEKSKRSSQFDPDTHPLNLPPEERRRLSSLAQSAMSGNNSMDIDREPVNGSTSRSGSPQNASAQKNFSVPIPNGTSNVETNGNSNGTESAPAPPPHGSNPSSPILTAEDDAEAYKAAGNRLFKEKNYAQAIQQYSKAIDLFPDSATYLSNRAAARMSSGAYEAALEDCTRAADLEPENPKILLRLARIYTALGRPDEAILTFDRINPPPSAKDMAPAREMLHHLSAAKDTLEKGSAMSMVLHALDQAEKGLGYGAGKPRKWQLLRGEAYLKMGRENALGEAQNIAMSLLRNNSQDPEALVLRGRVMYGQGENDKAIQLFRMALNCDPDFREAVKWLKIVQKLDRMKDEGNTHFKAGRYQAAIDKYGEALEIDPSNKSMNAKLLQNRAQCKIKLKKYNEAIADADKAVSLDPGYTKARKTKANALGQSGQWEESVKEWKSIQELDPEDRTIPKEIRKAELELKKSLRKDYYKIMELEKDCNDNDIKKAYRKMAVKLHPDKNPGDDQAEAKFKDMQEAYETLSDPQKRAAYDNGDDLMDPADMFGGGGGMGGMGGGMGGIDPEILFSMMGNQGGFGGGGFRGGGGGFPGGARGFPGGGGAGGFPGGAQFNYGGGGAGRNPFS